MYFVDYPDGTKSIRTTIYFDFNDTAGLPINMLSPALEHIQTAEYYAETQLAKWYCSFSASYSSITSEMANEATDEVSKQFLSAFDLNLNVTNSSCQTNNQTGAIETSRTYEPAPYDISTTEKLLKHKPSTVFGNLITEDFLSNYIPAESTTGMYITWSLTKSSDGFYWELLVIATSVTTWLSGNEKDKAIDLNLNKILNNTETIELNQSQITIEIENKHTFSSKTYSLNVTDIYPSSYIREEEGARTTITYNSTNSLPNVIITMVLNKEANSFNWLLAAIILSIVVLLIVAIFQKRRRGKTSERR